MEEWACTLKKDSETGAFYIQIDGSVPIAYGEAVEQCVLEVPGREMDVVLDFDAAGHLIGIEVIASPEVVTSAAKRKSAP
ncbi:DUF2283 domain-containing protein [Actinocorallia sp. API 0066]|uniref:DUF2283 domain-containing protein n=1 Tax=Actinocorallia sp. API 0066 TaxID=2896846 RepID=UPI001E303219|nr:DUF2283 domain-containing protein [Actinocorallia sp. API 0066]MCD0447598.1 DUF2283 domain-containing protein [Actinocorallia sp. API 0066]